MFRSFKNVFCLLALGLILAGCTTTPEGIPAVDPKLIAKSEADNLLSNAYKQIEDKDYAGAEESLRQAHEKDPDSPWVALNMGVVYQRTGRNDLAKAEYAKVLAADESATKANTAPPYGYWRNRLAVVAKTNMDLIRSEASAAPAKDSASVVPMSAPKALAQNGSGNGAQSPAEVNAEILTAVSGWRTAWVERNIDAYLNCYDSAFKGSFPNHAAWERKRREIIGKSSEINVSIADLRVFADSAKRAHATFRQTYSSSSKSDVVNKELQFVRVGERWLISSEVATPAF